MRRLFHILLIVALCTACKGRIQSPPSQTSCVQDFSVTAKTVYDDSVYCFNGRSIVGAEGLYGIADKTGNIIVPLRYASAGFLNDEIALLQDKDLWCLADTTGWIFYESPDKERIEEDYLMIHDNAVRANLAMWDQTLDLYEELCKRCLDAKIYRHATVSTLMNLSDRIKANLKTIAVRMSESQRERYREIRKRYDSL